MILSSQSIRARLETGMIHPWSERTNWGGMTFGLGPAGYDVRVERQVDLEPGWHVLASTVERFDMPDDLLAQVCDKSTWARRGLFVQNTVIEPGWCGYLTLELSWQGFVRAHIPAGAPIAQIIFMRLDHPTEQPYRGKYQDQEPGPQEAR